MCMIGDGEFVTVLHQRHPIARVEHKCNECGRTIQRGEAYMVERYVSEGEAATHKTCAHCQIARQWLMKECNGFIYSMVLDDIEEHIGEGGYERLQPLANGMRHQWRGLIDALVPIPDMPEVSA